MLHAPRIGSSVANCVIIIVVEEKKSSYDRALLVDSVRVRDRGGATRATPERHPPPHSSCASISPPPLPPPLPCVTSVFFSHGDFLREMQQASLGPAVSLNGFGETAEPCRPRIEVKEEFRLAPHLQRDDPAHRQGFMGYHHARFHHQGLYQPVDRHGFGGRGGARRKWNSGGAIRGLHPPVRNLFLVSHRFALFDAFFTLTHFFRINYDECSIMQLGVCQGGFLKHS